MARPRLAWLVAGCAVVVAVGCWLPWLSAAEGRASAVGGRIAAALPADRAAVPPPGFGLGQLVVLLAPVLLVTAAMTARAVAPRAASLASVLVAGLLLVCALGYQRRFTGAGVHAGSGWWVCVVTAGLATALAVPAAVAAWRGGPRR